MPKNEKSVDGKSGLESVRSRPLPPLTEREEQKAAFLQEVREASRESRALIGEAIRKAVREALDEPSGKGASAKNKK